MIRTAGHTRAAFAAVLLLALPATLNAAEPAATIHETFDAKFDAKRFLTPIPNKNTEVRGGTLWTHGSSGGKYPPMVYRVDPTTHNP